MRTRFVLLVIVAFLVIPITVSAQNAYKLDQVFAKLDEASKTVLSIEANVEQTHVTVVVDDHEVKSGKFYYQKRGKEPRLKLELTKPQAEFVLVEKGKGQIYLPKIKQVQEFSTQGHEDTVEMALALGFGQTSQDLKAHFDVALGDDEVIDGVKTTVLDLRPKSSKTFQAIRMWLDQRSWHAVQVKTVEKSGNFGILKYTNVKVVASIPDSRFRLDLPKDVKVIKLGG
jgi:outer membrane lipoprotein-sorting protein